MLTKTELNRAKCSIPDCTTNCDHDFYLHSLCHPQAGLDVCYDKVTERLTIRCHGCSALVAHIGVAEGEIIQ